ncbi:MAG TPA: hypothetical protein VJ483_04010 [Holophagaceae bacterium]|nr:hypothetical protein [Holophagaceae bacterium]
MHARECIKCAAPLPEGPEDQPFTCPYCGTVNEPTVARPTPLAAMLEKEEVKREAIKEAKAELKEQWAERAGAAPTALPPGALPPGFATRAVRRAGARGLGCCCGPTLAAGILLIALSASAPEGDRLRNLRELGHLAGLKLKPEGLATFHDQQRVVLDTPAPPGPFDPGRQSDWALDLALRWSPGARLTGIRAVRVRGDGTVDPADPRAETTFVFESIDKAHESLAHEARTPAEIIHGLTLRVVQGRVEARLAFGPAPKALPPSITTLPLGALLDKARSSGRLPDEPVYQATLSVDNGQPLWRLESIGTPASVHVRASDGRLLR